MFAFLSGVFVYFAIRCLLSGIYTVEQNERAVLTSFGRAIRHGNSRSIDHPMASGLTAEERERYDYPSVRIVSPGGPYFKWPWQKVHKVNVAIQTVSLALDPQSREANDGGTVLEAVTKDQLNVGLTGQIRYRVAEENLYGYLFGVKRPIAHVMGFFHSILRERISNYKAERPKQTGETEGVEAIAEQIEGVSINDLRKNLNHLNEQMDAECATSGLRYGIHLDASLITGIDPPQEIESALAAINTAHNEVSAQLSLAQAAADQKIEQSKRAVEIETMRAQAEVEPVVRQAEQLKTLKAQGALDSYVRNVRLDLFGRANRVIREIER